MNIDELIAFLNEQKAASPQAGAMPIFGRVNLLTPLIAPVASASVDYSTGQARVVLNLKVGG